jgi:hypothetical protein
VLPDPVEDPHESLLRNDEGISVHKKDPVLPFHVLGGEQNVTQNDLIILDLESLVFVRTAKGALIMGTTQGDLKQDTIGFAGGSDTIPFIMHSFAFNNSLHKVAIPCIFRKLYYYNIKL